MTELSKLILEKYQVRKSRKDKDAFIQLLKEHFDVKVHTQGFLKSRNLVIGDLEKAKVVFTAHYDTQAVLPFPNFITPFNIPKYIMMQIGLGMVLIVGCFVLMFILVAMNVPKDIALEIYYLCLFVMFMYVYFGIANKHTANDNTSGVLLLIEALQDPAFKDVACVFFDHEEVGILGSHAFAKEYQKLMKDKLVLNFDCIGDGKHFLFVYNQASTKYLSKLKDAFKDSPYEVLFESNKKAFYPSDQSAFKSAAIGVAALLKKKDYYLDKIHTSKDTVCDAENIRFLLEGLKNYL